MFYVFFSFFKEGSRGSATLWGGVESFYTDEDTFPSDDDDDDALTPWRLPFDQDLEQSTRRPIVTLSICIMCIKFLY